MKRFKYQGKIGLNEEGFPGPRSGFMRLRPWRPGAPAPRREEQVGLSSVDFFSKPLAILEGHSLNAQHRVDEMAT